MTPPSARTFQRRSTSPSWKRSNRPRKRSATHATPISTRSSSGAARMSKIGAISSSTPRRDVKEGNAGHTPRKPEKFKAFRAAGRDEFPSFLTYPRDRLTVARDLLTESGAIFVQIGDENVHRVRAVMDEVFGDQNAIV